MKIEINRSGKWETIHTSLAKIQVMPYGTLIGVSNKYYPIYHGQTFYVTDDDEMSMVPIEKGGDGPKPKYKQTKLDL